MRFLPLPCSPGYFSLLCGAALLPAIANAEDNAKPELETVAVYARQLQSDLLREQALTPGGVTLIDSDSLYQRNIGSMADMLRFAPGIWSESTSGSDGLFISSRGSNLDATAYDMNGIKLLQDGLPVTTADGNNHNRLIDPLSTRYATVARGANALTYGASTLGGAINFESPTARNSAAVQGYLSGGSDGLINARASAGGVVNDRFDGLLTLETKEFEGYREHSRQARDGVYANLGWQLSESAQTRLYMTYLNNDQDLSGALSADEARQNPDMADPSAVSGNYQKNVEAFRLASKTSWRLNDYSDFTVGVSWEEQSLYHPVVDKVLVDFDGPGPTPAVEVFSLLIDTDHRDAGAMARYNLRLGEHDLLFGLNYGDNKVTGGNYRNDGGERNGFTTRVDNSAESLELYAMDRWQLADNWTLVYGAQAVWAQREVSNITVADGSERNPEGDYDHINPRLGIIYALNDDSTVFANVSRLYEAPTNFELEDDLRASNDTLDAMHGTVAEIGTRGRQALGADSEWNWDIALYYARISDEILSVDDPAAPGTSLSANVDDTVHAGVEALFGASLALDSRGQHRIEPRVSVTINEFSFDDDRTYGDNDLPAAPGYAVRGELLYRHGSGVFAGPTFDLIDARYADFSNSYKVDSYQLLGLRAGYTASRWEVYAELKNLLDEDYIATFSVRDSAAANAEILNPGAPFSAYAGVCFSL